MSHSEFLPPISPKLSARRSAGAYVELLKPITWFAPMWAFGCGVASGGGGHWTQVIGGVLLAGPMVCGTSQVANDWFDRHVDALNEPQRPIPSGRVTGRRGLWFAVIWTVASLVLASLLGRFALGAAVAGLALAWAYSAPPLRLKADGRWGCAACGLCYEGLPWLTGAAITLGHGPGAAVWAAALLYSAGAYGIMTLNDFKSVQGDAVMGIRSLPVRMGVERAARFACVVMAVPQIIVVVGLTLLGHRLTASAVALLLAAQVGLMVRLLGSPRARAPWYNATGTSLYVLGMLATALALAP